MVKIDVEVYNEKKDTEKVKRFEVEHFNDGEGDMVEVTLGNESFIIDYEVWKFISRVTEDEKDGICRCEECVNG